MSIPATSARIRWRGTGDTETIESPDGTLSSLLVTIRTAAIERDRADGNAESGPEYRVLGYKAVPSIPSGRDREGRERYEICRIVHHRNGAPVLYTIGDARI